MLVFLFNYLHYRSGTRSVKFEKKKIAWLGQRFTMNEQLPRGRHRGEILFRS